MIREHANAFRTGDYVKAEKFLRSLRDERGILNSKQLKTLKGQALSGDLEGAIKGLERLKRQIRLGGI